MNLYMVGLWECNISRALKEYLVFMNSFINLWKWVVGNLQRMHLSCIKCIWEGYWVFINGKKGFVIRCIFHERFTGWLNCLFFFSVVLNPHRRFLANKWTQYVTHPVWPYDYIFSSIQPYATAAWLDTAHFNSPKTTI